MKVSSEVEIACSVAATEAGRRGHEMLTVEHLLYALLLDHETARVVRKAGGNVEGMRAELQRIFDDLGDEVPFLYDRAFGDERGDARLVDLGRLHVGRALDLDRLPRPEQRWAPPAGGRPPAGGPAP